MTVRRAQDDGTSVTEATLPNAGPQPRPRGRHAGRCSSAALRRARWTIFWERLWPALASLATAIGLFLALSWLGLWLWLPPLGRAVAVIACAAIAVVAACAVRVRCACPAPRDALSRLDRGSGLPHRPATAIADELAVTPKDPYSLALWNAHVERALAAARALKSGWPSPRVARRDPYALRALVLIACVATFFAAGGERWKRITAAFDWHGVVLPANFRVDAWVIPPAYTGKPPLILPGIHPGETAALPADGIGRRAGQFDAGGALDRQGQSRRLRHRRRHAGEGRGAGAGRHRRASLHHHRDRQRRPCAAPATI